MVLCRLELCRLELCKLELCRLELCSFLRNSVWCEETQRNLASVVDHWWLKPEVLGSIPAIYFAIYFTIYFAEVNRWWSPGIKPNTSGLSHQWSTTELSPLDNHICAQSSLYIYSTALYIASVAHPAATCIDCQGAHLILICKNSFTALTLQVIWSLW